MSQLAKSYKLSDPQQCSSGEGKTTTDWKKCCLCQKATKESLQCPAKSKRHDIGVGQGYSTICTNITRFSELDELPMSIDLDRLDEGSGMEATMISNQAMWHKSCYNKFNVTKLKRAEKRKSSTADEPEIFPCRKYTRQTTFQEPTKDICFFCAEGKSASETLREAATLRLDSRVRKCALDLQDQSLLAKLSAGDMIALEAKYHPKCLVSLYNRAAALENKDNYDQSDNFSHGIALAELVTYIDETRMSADVAPVFKLSDLVKLYSSKLEQLGVQQNSRPHSTDLKNRILAQFPELQAIKEGRDVLLVFNDDMGPALRKACELDVDDDAICLARAAKIVRRDILEMQAKFTGSFNHDCQIKSVPYSLLALVDMIHNGPNIKSNSISQATLSVAQLLQYNTSIRRRAESISMYHSRTRETPLPIYVGLLMHARTRRRDLIESLFGLGLSISYDRVMEISTAMNNYVCEQYRSENVVCPRNLHEGLFITAAIDNIDHNPSSTTTKDSFHGTGISLFQHVNLQQSEPEVLDCVIDQSSIGKTLLELPASYTNVQPVVESKKDVSLPRADYPLRTEYNTYNQELQKEFGWLSQVEEKYLQNISQDSNISWAAYHASQQPVPSSSLPVTTAMLPLFNEDSKSVAMIRHSMDVIRQAVQKLNSVQVPVITLDQPLYATAKYIQWNWSDNYGEDCFVIILGGLHIEMAGLKVIGDWLEDSGWVEALVQAKVASAGIADSFIKVSHVTRTRHAHQVTASSLYILLRKSYTLYIESLESTEQQESFEIWSDRRRQESPQFQYWYTALQLELLVLIYVKSLRIANFSLYIECLMKLAPWFFSLDHTNYARWLPVHIRDMINLSVRHPTVALEFNKGYFTVHKTERVFSSMAIDQAHEQNNAAVKSEGGAIGLMQNTDALRRWMVAGPELVRMTSEFETCIEKVHKKASVLLHHDQTKSTQATFANQVKNLVDIMQEMGNPFMEESKDLLRLDTRDIIDERAASVICQAEELGKEQYNTFVTDRLLDQSTPLSEPIKRNKLPLFSRPPPREKSKASLQVSSLKSDVSLFSRLYIACQSRDGDLDEFFRHENQACPPSLSNNGKLRQGTKADLLNCLENCTDVEMPTLESTHPDTEVAILDGAVIVNFLKPVSAKTFTDYAVKVFLPYIESKLYNVSRVDVVWDQYIPNSLKHQTRSKRGKGIRRRVEASNALPNNWQDFLRDDANKTELFTFLAKHISHMVTVKQIITTTGSGVVCIPPQDTSHLAPCDHEEADTRMILHMADAVNKGFKKILLRTVDTDVVVLSVAATAKLCIEELWIAFGTGRKFRYIPVHEMAKAIGPRKSQALPMFHAYTGCDTVSAFATRGKKSAWDTWLAYEEVTTTFLDLSTAPNDISEGDIVVLERFSILLYDRTSSLINIDEARKQLFSKKGRAMDAIPPTRAALVQHIKRAIYQGGHCWGKMLEVSQNLPSPGQWGWTDSSNWKPLWTTLPEASSSSRELLSCGCKKSCRGQCKCKKAALKCTALCQCGGDCNIN